MKTQKYIKKKDKKGKKTRKNNSKKTKRNLSKQKKYKIKKVGGAGTSWEELPPYLQKLSNRKGQNYTKLITDDTIDYCENYKDDEAININYKVSEAEVDSESPLKLFRERGDSNAYDTIESGIHNFILCWDDVKKEYMLITSFFNAYEYGQKHYMMSYRLDQMFPNPDEKAPDTFIFSGEFKKDETTTIKFHDMSSLYFLDNSLNLKSSMVNYYLYQLLKEYTPDDLQKPETIKDLIPKFISLLENNQVRLFPPKKRALNQIKDIETLKLFVENNQLTNMPRTPEYELYLKNILKDAFKHIFDKNIETVYVAGFSKGEYAEHAQLDKEGFIDNMCKLTPPRAFDVYKDLDDCNKKVNPIKKSCDPSEEKFKRIRTE
jgi:hypothetical protein